MESLFGFCGVGLVEGGLFLKFYKNTRHTAQKTFLNPTNPHLTNWESGQLYNLVKTPQSYNQLGIR